MKSSFIRYFFQYFISFFLVMVLFDLGFDESIQWLRNALAALVFSILMSYFRAR